MKKCNAGIIGLGNFAHLILKSLENQNVISVTAAADLDKNRQEEIKRDFGIQKIYGDSHYILKDPGIDLVIIATPPYFHSKLGKEALLARKNVFFEKPGALVSEQMEELIDICKQYNLKASIDYVMRRNPLYFILKEICKNYFLGLPERAFLENYAHDDSLPQEHWFWNYNKSGGIWVEHGVHFFDLTNWLFETPLNVYSKNYVRKGSGIIDRVLGNAFHKDGVIVSYYHGFTKPEIFEKTYFSVVFEKAYVKAEGWIPIKLSIDAMVTPQLERYMMEELLNKARGYLPGVDVTLETEILKELPEGCQLIRGRGKEYKAQRRVKFIYRLDKDRWEVYSRCVCKGLLDLVSAINGEKLQPDVTLVDAKKALDVALLMEKHEI